MTAVFAAHVRRKGRRAAPAAFIARPAIRPAPSAAFLG
jgi:hypothetical protein